jgi:hypothetical protein
MILNRMRTIIVRWWITVIACLAFAASAPAQSPESAEIDGVYNGSYAGEQGQIKFKLSITQPRRGILAGVFTFYLPEGSDTKAYTCDFTGYLRANRTFLLTRRKWETPPPSGIDMAAGMNGLFDPAGGNGAGKISGRMRDRSGPNFQAIRDADESANMASASADTKEAGASATPVARSERRPAAAKPAAPPPSLPAQGPHVNWLTAINGVYTGTYGTNTDDNVTAKLYVKFIKDGSVDGPLTGLFTFDLPPSLGAKPITYTYKLIGETEPGNGFGFRSAKPLGKPAPDAYAVTQLWVNFGRIPLVKDRNGQYENSFNPDQISGRVIGSNGLASNNFAAVRDQAGSAELDSLMAAAAQASAAGPVVSTTEPTQPPTVAPVVRPGIQGVFNGTYTREKEPPTKFKLTITQERDGLAGVATIYLPTDSGTKAYTYSLTGAQVPYAPRDFNLKVMDWEAIPPKDFKNFRGMGFNGRFLSNMTWNTARIISVQQSGSNASLFVPQFEAAWDAKESADIKGTIAAQKAVGDADQIAALKAQAEAQLLGPDLRTSGMEIRYFDSMADQDQEDYIERLVQKVENAVSGEEYTRVKEFFAPRDIGEGVSGMTAFEYDLALGRVADLELGDPRLHLEVGDALRATLEKNDIVLPPSFRFVVADFRPRYSVHQPVSKEVAERYRKQLEAEIARKTGDVPRAELENPPDAAWVDKLDFAEPKIIKALFTGDFTLPQLRTQVLTYIAALNENLKADCPNLYDSSITSKAEGQMDARLATGYGLPAGDLSDLRMQLERRTMDADSGGRDAHTLFSHAPEGEGSIILKRIYRNMEIYVQPR